MEQKMNDNDLLNLCLVLNEVTPQFLYLLTSFWDVFMTPDNFNQVTKYVCHMAIY